MRPLYCYYRKLKAMIGNVSTSRQGYALSQRSSRDRRATPSSQQQQGGAKSGSAVSGRSEVPLSEVPSSRGDSAQDLGESGARAPRHREPARQQGVDVPAASSNNDEGERYRQRLDQLYREKTRLRHVLQKYQTKFMAENSRKIRFHKDILPIEREYKCYKQCKQEIQRLTSLLGTSGSAEAVSDVD